MPITLPLGLLHPEFGECTLLRIEGTDWIVQTPGSAKPHRFPTELRRQFTVAPTPDATPPPPPVTPKPPNDATGVPTPEVVEVVPEPIRSPPCRQSTGMRAPGRPPQDQDRRRLRRTLESFRGGLPPQDPDARQLAVGFDELSRLLDGFLTDDVANAGGGALMLMGHYGQGKTFALQMLHDVALEQGFAVARAEIDAGENRLSKPHHLYRNLMKSLRFPDGDPIGGPGLGERVHNYLLPLNKESVEERWLHLQETTGCEPISWLLSSWDIYTQHHMLLEANPDYPATFVRQYHDIQATPRTWPVFNASTQGDFGSYLLSGIGVLIRELGYQGLVVIFDEMEKWHDLNWKEQQRAGNLMGGLIWAATAESGRRGRGDPPSSLEHSRRCGGYPFTTAKRCHLGVVIAMTPRGDGSEDLWAPFGPVQTGYVPKMTTQKLGLFVRRLIPHYCRAYDLPPPSADVQAGIERKSQELWRDVGDLNTRSGVQSAIQALDLWRKGDSGPAPQ